MSDDLLRIIPTDQNYVPDNDRQQRALGLIKTMRPDADEHEATVYDELTFIDQGVNCEAVLCPSCGARLRTDDDDDRWWRDITEEVADRSVADVRITMPCCGGMFRCRLFGSIGQQASRISKFVSRIQGRTTTSYPRRNCGSCRTC